MTALDFPATPVVNDQYPQPPVSGKPVYTWDGIKWTTGDTTIQAAGEPSNALPRMDADPAQVGTLLDYARGDHRHPIDASRAPIHEPTFSGAPMADTPPMGDNSNRLATTAYVAGAAFTIGSALPSNSTPLPDGDPQPGTSMLFARDDHVHPTDPSRAPLHAPVFTGTPEAPTPDPSSNGTQLATTAFVMDAIDVIGGIAPSDVVPLIDSGTGAAGSSTAYARGDHVHPAGPAPTPPATELPLMDGDTAAVGVANKYAREDHVHPHDATKVTTSDMETALASKSNVTHQHQSTAITDFSEAVDDRVAALLTAGANISLDYNDTANMLTITSTASGGGAGSGDVTGPVGSVADHIAIFNSTTGKIIKDGGSLISDLQPADAELSAIAGLTSAADRLPYFTGAGTASLATFTGAARTLLDDVDAPTMRSTLGLTSPATATPAALSKTDDTNVTLTLGGTPSTALLQPASITAGWAGALSAARGGFGGNISSQSGVPLFATGVPTFTGTNGTGSFVRTDGPVLSGDARATTAAPGDNDTTIATTAFVTAADAVVQTEKVAKTGDTMSGMLTATNGIMVTAGGISVSPWGAGNYITFISGANSYSISHSSIGISSLNATPAGLRHSLAFAGTNYFQFDIAYFFPATGNPTLGTGSFKWGQIYSTVATISTSDERLKQDIRPLNEAEKRVAVALRGLIVVYRLKESVAEKGDAARIHSGIIAQRVVEAFAAEGLDATRYGLYCADEQYTEEYIDDPETGGRYEKHLTGEVAYSIRYEELLAFIIGGL